MAGPGHDPVEQLNQHHADDVLAVARAFGGRPDATAAQVVAYDALPGHPLPQGVVLVAGVIDTTTNYVEHPEVVADRLTRAADAVGDPHRIMAGTECRFGTAAGMAEVAPSLVWEKLKALRDGADLATDRLL
jgi:5-methyltetrahydropteroyltriglutamate--homocysteine methyltransferase